MRTAKGVVMELDDGTLPLLASTEIYDDPVRGFDGVDAALPIGAKPRTKGMDRADLFEANAQIFGPPVKRSTPGPEPTCGCWWSAIRPTPTR